METIVSKLLHGYVTALVLSVVSVTGFANSQTDPLIGKWKTIDDRTGYSRADVEIRKKTDGTYEGIIVETRNVPGAEKMLICKTCPDQFKNRPYVGLPFIWGFKTDPSNPKSFIDGNVLDPIGGKIYTAKARLTGNDKRLIIRGYVGVPVIGRSVTWIKY